MSRIDDRNRDHVGCQNKKSCQGKVREVSRFSIHDSILSELKIDKRRFVRGPGCPDRQAKEGVREGARPEGE